MGYLRNEIATRKHINVVLVDITCECAVYLFTFHPIPGMPGANGCLAASKSKQHLPGAAEVGLQKQHTWHVLNVVWGIMGPVLLYQFLGLWSFRVIFWCHHREFRHPCSPSSPPSRRGSGRKWKVWAPKGDRASQLGSWAHNEYPNIHLGKL